MCSLRLHRRDEIEGLGPLALGRRNLFESSLNSAVIKVKVFIPKKYLTFWTNVLLYTHINQNGP
jgi:hypothetical protein